MTVDKDPIAKALAHPIRLGVMVWMSTGVETPSDLADSMGLPLGVVSYHVRMLASYGLIEVSHTEQRRGALQHFYRFTPFAVDGLLATRDAVNEMIGAARQGTKVKTTRRGQVVSGVVTSSYLNNAKELVYVVRKADNKEITIMDRDLTKED